MCTHGVTFGWLCDGDIAREVRGRGIGTALPQVIVDAVRPLDPQRFMLSTRDDSHICISVVSSMLIIQFVQDLGQCLQVAAPATIAATTVTMTMYVIVKATTNRPRWLSLRQTSRTIGGRQQQSTSDDIE